MRTVELINIIEKNKQKQGFVILIYSVDFKSYVQVSPLHAENHLIAHSGEINALVENDCLFIGGDEKSLIVGGGCCCIIAF